MLDYYFFILILLLLYTYNFICNFYFFKLVYVFNF